MRTTETSSHSENSTLRKVPTLSLASYTQGSDSDRAKFIDNLFTGLKEYGFIILKDHNVKAEALHKAYDILKSFYSLPTEVKNPIFLLKRVFNVVTLRSVKSMRRILQ